MDGELWIAVQAGVPTIVWGEPGVGKSARIQALGRALGLPVEVVIASIREPSDFAGLPIILDGGARSHLFGGDSGASESHHPQLVHMAPPAWALRLARSGRGILFLDEISTAPPAVQAALLRVVLDRVVGDLRLPPAVQVVAAANPPELAAAGWDLAPPLANRLCHLTWKLDSEPWIAGMILGWPVPSVARLPEGWPAAIPHARSLVAAFIQARPSLLLQVPGSPEAAGHAWPSPRTWDMAARLWAASGAAGAALELRAGLMVGCVGEGPGLEFVHWIQEQDLPDPEALLADPDHFRLPERSDLTFAILSGVVAAALTDLTPSRWAAAWEILGRAASEGGADVGAIAARALAQARRPELRVPAAVKSFLPVLNAAGLI